MSKSNLTVAIAHTVTNRTVEVGMGTGTEYIVLVLPFTDTVGKTNRLLLKKRKYKSCHVASFLYRWVFATLIKAGLAITIFCYNMWGLIRQVTNRKLVATRLLVMLLCFVESLLMSYYFLAYYQDMDNRDNSDKLETFLISGTVIVVIFGWIGYCSRMVFFYQDLQVTM